MILTLQQAKDHLRIPADDTAHDGDLAIKLQAAESMVLGMIGTRVDEGWATGTVDVPYPVHAAICVLLTDQWENRGNDMRMSAYATAAAGRYLEISGVKDPAIA